MNNIEFPRTTLIESYTESHRNLIATLVKCPRIMWEYKPAPNEWSIRQIIIHLADSEAHAYIRCRRILAEPGQNVIAYDQDVWARELDYVNQDPDDALEFFRIARKLTARLLRNLPEAAWSRTMLHPEAGVVSLEGWLAINASHASQHIQQIQRVFRHWQQQQHPDPTVALPDDQRMAQEQ